MTTAQSPARTGETRSQTEVHRPIRVRPGPANRCRAAKACRKCNEKRVKCDASERGTPCTRCVDRGEPECTLIQSRRGMYVRKPRQPKQKSQGDSGRVCGVNEGDGLDDDTTAYAIYGDDDAQQTVAAATHPAAEGAIDPGPGSNISSSQQELTGHEAGRPTIQAHEGHHPQSRYDPPSLGPDTSPSGTEASDASSYREISWATMFSHLLEGRHKGEDVVDKGSITYLGESFPLAIVLKDLAGIGGRPKLHHPGPPCPANDELAEPQGLQHPPYMRPEDVAFLDAKKAFETPEKQTLDALVDVFLNRVFPLYPIVNRNEFIQQYTAKRTPWILLHAVCFISATFCPSHIIHKIGFESRREARWLFYSKAKALFDVGYEGDKIIALQVSIMMTFWGGGPNMYWNFYSWVSTGVTIAETLGCHRSMAGANIKPQDRSLLKRLWWVLVIRDTACAALVGRPFRVNLDHCDIDRLTLEDFEHDAASIGFCTNPLARCSGQYQIEATKLSLILRRIIMTRFYPRRDTALVPSSLKKMLTDWRAQLPPELAWSENSARHPNILTSCLCVQYNHNMILTHLNCPVELMQASPTGGPYGTCQPFDDISNASAQQIASTACAVVTKSEILLAPHELLHGIFIAAVVFYKQTKSQQSMMAQLGLAGLTNCQMVLHETREAWDPSPWIQHILDKVLSTSTTHPDDVLDEDQPAQPTEPVLDNSASMNMYGTAMFPTGFEMWQSYPVLGNLFDIPPTGSIMPMTPNFGERSGDTPWI